jgi:hypothetical protein
LRAQFRPQVQERPRAATGKGHGLATFEENFLREPGVADLVDRLARAIPGRRAVAVALWGTAIFAASLAIGAAASQKPDGSAGPSRAVQISAQPLYSFLRSGQDTQRFGSLRFLGGLVLYSGDKAFGGYSGMELSSDGTSLLAVSDAGTWLRAELDMTGGRPSGIKSARIGRLLALGSRRLTRSKDRDAEALRLVKGTLDEGVALVSFERNERIGYFDIANGELKAPVRYLRPPRRLPHNKGIEAAAVLKHGAQKGRVIAFAERSTDANGHHRGWIWVDGRPMAVALTDVGGFDVTDVALAPDGDLYVLERRFRWSEGVKMRVRHIAAAAVKPGAVLDGRVVVRTDMRHEIDNMEAMSLHRDKRGRLVLTLMLDDNFNNFLQRTLLLQFIVDEAALKQRG